MVPGSAAITRLTDTLRVVPEVVVMVTILSGGDGPSEQRPAAPTRGRGRTGTPAPRARREAPAGRVNSSESASLLPSSNFGPKLGTGRTVGRCRTVPRTRVISALVTGAGAVALTGPATWWLPRSQRMAPTSSSRLIQLHHCRPEPMRPPRPSLNSGSNLASAPPWGLSTMPVRRCATRMPASSAGAVAASQSRHTSARKSCPAAASSVTAVPPVSP